MMCPPPQRLAAAVSGEDQAVIEHARECLTCRATLTEQRELIAMARMMRVPPMRAEHRAALAAEVMAQTDYEDTQRPWRGERVMAIAASIVAAAAVITIVLASPGAKPSIPGAPAIALNDDEPTVDTVARVHLEPVAAPRRAAVIAVGADYARMQHGGRDVVTLRDGAVSIDTTDREPITVIAGDTQVTVTGARAKVVARRGVIVTTHVFAGTAHVTAAGRSEVIDAGDVWMRPPEETTEANRAAVSLSAFRVGWEALRAHRNTQAIAAFDRATDPVVAEDAAFWAGIASERAGDLEGAAQRLRDFLERFPGSPRADAARTALERVRK